MAATYTIRDGDTLETVAKQLGVDAAQLASDNNLSVGAALKAGNVLNVPTATAATTAATGAAAKAATPYTGMAGLSDETSQKLGEYAGGYTPSSTVTAAQEYLNGVLAQKPGEYVSQYQSQLDALYDRIMNREDFSYDLNGDMLYQLYRDQYAQQGKQAMQDTMGQAAALSGGYGSSYASTAGNQAYQAYLQQLNAMVPELYQQALARYNAEGDQLMEQYGMTAELENDAYGKYRDTVSDWNAEREYASSDYRDKYDSDYANYATMLEYWNQLAQQENAQYNSDRELAYSQAMAILQAGKMPSNALLKAAGISSADAKTLKSAYSKSSGSGSGSGGSSRSSYSYSRGSSGSSGSSSSGSSSSTTLGRSATEIYNTVAAGMKLKGTSATQSVKNVSSAVNSGKITAAEGKIILDKLGI